MIAIGREHHGPTAFHRAAGRRRQRAGAGFRRGAALTSRKNSLARRQAAYRRGHSGEWLAALRLMLGGYRILARRYRTRMGEIDLVARRGRVLAFVEVKRRPDFTTGIEAVTPAAQLRIRRAAELFVRRYPSFSELALRFDIIVITPFAWPRHIVDAWRD